jgi:hypothetical protein
MKQAGSPMSFQAYEDADLKVQIKEALDGNKARIEAS